VTGLGVGVGLGVELAFGVDDFFDFDRGGQGLYGGYTGYSCCLVVSGLLAEELAGAEGCDGTVVKEDLIGSGTGV
jgi:hypothetical protein